MNHSAPELVTRAHQAMLDEDFHPDFTADIIQQAKTAPSANSSPKTTDMRGLLWSSIDNDNSRDLDQVEFVERLQDGTLRLLVGIADVDSLVPAGSPADKHAASETTSVYTGVTTFPMLPGEFSNERTSLVGDEDRPALVIEMRISESGEVVCHDVFRATLRNHAKLAYSATGAWLQGDAQMPPVVAAVSGLDAQLKLQLETSQKLRAIREAHGMISFSSVEATPVVENGEVKSLRVAPHNVAEDIIESFMVAANVAMARHLKEKQSASISRVVKIPKRWDRIQEIAAQYGTKLPAVPDSKALAEFLDQRQTADPLHFPDLSLSIVKMMGPGQYIVEQPGATPEGHFGLAVQDYTHSTAPNRRYADLVTQRLLKATIDGAPCPYTEKELSDIADHCTERENAARKVERLMRKIVAASMLRQQIGQIFDGVVTGASPKGTYVRLLKFPAEGMVVRGAKGLDVGDKVTVCLLNADVNKGFIDFERK